ncbi:MAG: immunoglobulin-like domain-containing protein, partial [Bacillota bacterium]
MKKILVLSLLVLFTFGLAACDLTGEDIDDDDIDDIVCDDDETLVDGECVPDEDDTPADTTAPTIEGVEDVEIFVGADFDPMDDVTATDDTDGDVTEDVTYTGTFDVDSAGTYFIKYSVEDEAGNVREETRYITVVIDPSSVGDEMVPNGDFSLGWAIWNTTTGNEGGQATYSVEDEELVIEITSVSGGMWEPRLQNSGITF